MHAQAAGGFGNIKPGFRQRFVDAFPFQGFQIRGTGRQGHIGGAFRPVEGIFDIVGIGRLGQVMAGPQLHGFHRRGDTGITGQHHNQHVFIVLMERLHTGQSGRFALELQIDHGIARLMVFQQRLHGFQAVRMNHLITPTLERAGQGAGKGVIVFHNQ